MTMPMEESMLVHEYGTNTRRNVMNQDRHILMKYEDDVYNRDILLNRSVTSREMGLNIIRPLRANYGIIRLL